ncbi:MAG: cbb3-type cytochrome oxidase subunit 3 [Gammaproteobacteria bacterium]
MILSLWTVAVLIIFLVIAVWAWSGKNKAVFDAAARMPLEDDDAEEDTDRG